MKKNFVPFAKDGTFTGLSGLLAVVSGLLMVVSGLLMVVSGLLIPVSIRVQVLPIPQPISVTQIVHLHAINVTSYMRAHAL